MKFYWASDRYLDLILIRKIARFVNASPQRREKFQLTQRLESGSVYYLLLDCKTCWNSTYLMIRRALNLRQAINSFIQHCDYGNINHLCPTTIEWKQMEYLLKLLYPFFLFTSCLSENSGPTVHKIYDIYNNLFDHLDHSINRLAEGYIYAIATILDPMSKLEKFKKDAWLDDDTDWYLEYRTVFKKVFYFYCSQNPAINTPSTISGSLSGLDKAFYNISKRRRLSPAAETFKELKAYLDIEGTTGHTDILTYWKSRRNQFPILYQMARDFLSVATNGVSVERLLNSSRDICHYRRSRLHPDTIKAVMLQIYTDRFTISKKYQDILNNLNPDSIIFTPKKQEEDEVITTFYISENKDIDDLEDDPKDGSLLETGELALPESSNITRTQIEIETRPSRFLRHHNHRPGQYKE
ncbi:hypothetical protein ASPACDRAFT_62071 [Aspergillus aculeatus ATCC 16872]|uniref:HAT C-terminal dimerisation domain-containing protein n=1 Tax=Aspergillus aculeatus (strain ATCC 16872 / CBS 172.66 / WB 5094) TaxID=690307 RepID=A0A1L9WQX3_ASPA1|nr:uncharacterized protein ASPACDRAFT_62071 [Aspergillus aculeatus ATCC 16872]OJJ98579.1 hypothetical protein ASPACDRAFT_62071 [Aspergillus aculeatus ATCC 16872]